LPKPWLLPRSEARGGPKYSLRVVLEPLTSLSDAPWHSLTTACWYMCASGKSRNALVARDKTRTAQSSRSSSGVWRALLNWTWAVSGSSRKPNRVSSFRMRSMYAISWLRSTKRA
jgi:hypothetical protein